MAKLTSFSVRLRSPFVGELSGTWEPDDAERNAAWEMYVELVTRISVTELRPNEGLLREALSSLYTLFGTTREILRRYGPDVAKMKGKSDLSFAYIAVAVLNLALRPVLAKWHPQLLDHESTRPPAVSQLDHEREWSLSGELRADLESVRKTLVDYADLLGEVAGVSSLIVQRQD